MDKLYAPWRNRYVTQAIKGWQKSECVFCQLFDGNESGDQRFILYKNESFAVLLNLYPYNGGHLLIVPKNHTDSFQDLSLDQQKTLMPLVIKSMAILQQELQAEGMNFGANIGRFGGAGIPEHIHMHIVPRFAGDIGFFTTIGDTKQISVDLEKIYNRLKPLFNENFANF